MPKSSEIQQMLRNAVRVPAHLSKSRYIKIAGKRHHYCERNSAYSTQGLKLIMVFNLELKLMRDLLCVPLHTTSSDPMSHYVEVAL